MQVNWMYITTSYNGWLFMFDSYLCTKSEAKLSSIAYFELALTSITSVNELKI